MRMVLNMTHFQTLGVTPSANDAEVRAAWIEKRKSFSRTGDWNNDAEREVNDAYSALRTENDRAGYLSRLRFTMDVCKKCGGAGKVQETISWHTTLLVTCEACSGAGFFDRK